MYMHVCLYMYVYIFKHVYVCMYMYACICMYTYVCICICVCICMHDTYVCICVCMHVYVCMHNISGGIVRGKCPTQNGRGNWACKSSTCNCLYDVMLRPVASLRLN